MSETYPYKKPYETLFAGHISLQHRFRLQRYYIFLNCTKDLKKIVQIFPRSSVGGIKESIREVKRDRNLNFFSVT